MIVFILSILLSILTILGFGKFFQKFFFSKDIFFNIGLVGIFGLFFLSFISYLTHLFFPHNYLHNSIIFIIGLVLFFYFHKKEQIKINKNFYIILLCLFVGVFIAKSHDDFPYYHLSNAIHFTQNKLELGLGNLNHGFKHHSSLFYLYSIFYLPFIDYYLFNVLNFLFLLFTSIFLFDFIENDFLKHRFNKNTLIKIVFLILCISIFNRIGAYGADITGQLLSIILICLSLDLIEKKEIKLNDISIIITLLVYLITIKTYFVLYAILPILLFFYTKNNIGILKKLIISKIFVFFILTGFLFVVINISATGCVIYPVPVLCFPNYFSWGIPLSTVNYMSDWYEIWSKAGAGPDFREKDPVVYIQKLNWLDNWINRYFFTKVSDFLFSIFIGYFIVYFIFKKNLKIKFQYNSKENIILFGLFLIFIIWFYKFPSLRYGGYAIVLSIFTIIFSKFFSYSNFQFNNIRKNFLIIFSLSIFIFVSKNLLRINKEFHYSAVDNFKSFPLFYVKDVEFDRIKINDEEVYKVEGMCWATPSPCLRNINKKIIKIKNYRVYLDN
jgi:hypothetical protein